MLNTSRPWVLMLIVGLTVAALGCATTTSTARPITDLAPLVGTWSGWLYPTSGGGTPGTWQMAPNGDYVVRAGAFSAEGKATVKDGTLLLTSTTGTGALASGERDATASLTELPDGTLVLKGKGYGRTGPFNFEVTRPKR